MATNEDNMTLFHDILQAAIRVYEIWYHKSFEVI